MRDLASKQYTNRNISKKDPKNLLKIIFIIILVISVVGFIKSKLNIGEGSDSTVLHDAPYNLEGVDLKDTDITAGGTNLKTQKINLVDVEFGGRAKGSATRSFGGGSYILSVDATIPNAKDQLWEVWLADNDGTLREVDFMKCTGNACSYTLRDSDDYSSYSHIWITRELTNQDNKPELHILEGEW